MRNPEDVSSFDQAWILVPMLMLAVGLIYFLVQIVLE